MIWVWWGGMNELQNGGSLRGEQRIAQEKHFPQITDGVMRGDDYSEFF